MAAPILILAVGSSSKKYALLDDDRELVRVLVEQTGPGAELSVRSVHAGKTTSETWPVDDYPRATERVLELFQRQGSLASPNSLGAVGMRIVAPGPRFARHQRIDDEFRAHLAQAAARWPLHIQPVLEELAVLARLFPALPIVAASDSAFHATLPEYARRYAIPQALAKRYHLYRTGYHGLSVASVVRTLKHDTGQIPSRTVVCHLGSGVSITALQDGVSVDTSMGATPLEGIPMGRRVGDIDPGAVLTLLDDNSIDQAKLQTILTEESGLLALSGTTGDVKTLLAQREHGDAAATSALETFVYRIRKYVGAYAAALGGLDALILTGAIGERSSAIRQEICVPLDFLGVRLDVMKNATLTEEGGIISTNASAVKVWAVPTDELGEIARITQTATSGPRNP